jgi:sugar phosphate isomerase/epimerase
MKFGMPTLLELKGIESNVQMCKHLGLQFLEINCNEPIYQSESLDWLQLKDLKQQTGIGYTLHLDEFLSISDPNQRIAEAYLNSVLASIEMAKALDIRYLTMHVLKGVVYTLPQEKVYVYDQYQDFYHQRLIHFRDAVSQAVKGTNIKLCIENTEGFESFMKRGIELLLESSSFALTYDSGHIERYDGIDEAFMHKHQKRIAHMHLHDCIHQRDHIPLGQGNSDLMKHISLVKPFLDQILIEVKTVSGLKSSIQYLKSLEI